MYSIHQFNKLSKPKKWAIIEDHGAYSGLFRMDDNLKICLFLLYGYYVEVFYNEGRDQLVTAIAFDNYGCLDRYVNQIDLTEVYAVL